MKTTNTATFTLFLLILFASSMVAQKPRPSAKPAAVPVAPVSNFEIKAGAEKVSVQIKNVTKFLYTLGGIAVRIEDFDKEAKTRSLAKNSLEINAENKQKVLQAIRNLRAGIATLEVEFRTKPALTKYLIYIQGISELSEQTEDLALAGSFSESGKPLLTLVERLSDTLAAMP